MIAIKIFFYFKKTILAVFIIIVTTSIVSIRDNAGYYNNLVYLKYREILAPNTLSLIMTTTTGAKKFETSDIKNLYKNLNIIHLVVLSGSNLGIILLFVNFLKRRGSISRFVIIFLLLLSYLSFVNFLHPVVRAFLFMTINEFIESLGFKQSKFVVILILVLVFSYSYFQLDFSVSFILSVLFFFIVLLYTFSHKTHSLSQKVVSTVIIFPIYMTFASVPVILYFFKEIEFTRLLLSNLLIVPYYDLFVFLMYLFMILSLFPTDSSFVLYTISYLLDFLLYYLFVLNEVFNSYNI